MGLPFDFLSKKQKPTPPFAAPNRGVPGWPGGPQRAVQGPPSLPFNWQAPGLGFNQMAQLLGQGIAPPEGPAMQMPPDLLQRYMSRNIKLPGLLNAGSAG